MLDAEAAPPERVIEAAESCPCGAIVIEDDAIDDETLEDGAIEDGTIEDETFADEVPERSTERPADA